MPSKVKLKVKLTKWLSVPFRSSNKSSAFNEKCDLQCGVYRASMADNLVFAKDYFLFPPEMR